MYRAVSASRRVSGYLPCPDRCSLAPAFARCFGSVGRPFAERDIVLLRQKSDLSAPSILTKPLATQGKIQTHKGTLNHSDIIGKHPRDVVRSSSGAEFRVHQVSLGDYVRLSKRLVTPIYPADANLIVSLFDLHVSPPAPTLDSNEEPRLEILEAGTGHGALTLHLSRAIHAANSPKPSIEEADPTPADKDLENPPEENPENHSDGADGDGSVTPKDDPLAQWKADRRAVLHTIDVSPKYSKHARKVVNGFRHGMYMGNVDFHVGDVSEWIQLERARRAQAQPASSSIPESGDATQDQPFLTHAFLDLPSTHSHLSTVASALHNDGILVVFNPSVTQIAECMQKIKQDSLPLLLEQTLELGQNGTSGGREWDVRAVKPRAMVKKQQESPSESKATDTETEGAERNSEQADIAEENSPWTLVCRPKVGDRVTGGGFLGVFRKMKDRSD